MAAAVTKSKKRGGPPAKVAFVKASTLPEVVFEDHRRRSPYYEALCELLKRRSAGDDSYLEVDRVTARGAISSQANKHGIKAIFAEHGGRLYVKVLGGPEAIMLEFLKTGPKTMHEITEFFASKRMKEVKPAEVVRLLSENSQITLKSYPNSSDRKWALA